jgi:hypothetical protein
MTMAAVGQGQASGDGGQQGEGQAQQGQQAQGGADLSQLAAQFEQFGGNLEQVYNLLQQQQAAQQQGQEDEGGIDLSTLDQTFYDPEQSQAIQTYAQQVAQQAVAPLAQRVAQQDQRMEEMRRSQEATHLAGLYPELEDMGAAQKLAGPGGLVEQTLQNASGLPPEVTQILHAEPWFWGLVHEASKAREIANQEGSGDPGAASLESGSGAGPAQMTQEDRVKQIMNAGGRGSRVLDGM